MPGIQSNNFLKMGVHDYPKCNPYKMLGIIMYTWQGSKILLTPTRFDLVSPPLKHELAALMESDKDFTIF